VTGKLLRLLFAGVLMLAVGVVAGCGGDDDSGSSSSSASKTAEAKQIKVGLVTDIGGLNDRSFNQAAYQGLKRAEKDLGVQVRVITSTKNSDYVPNLSSLARQKYDLVVANGFLMAEAVEKTAKSFPTTNFAIIDSSQADMKSKPKNVNGLLFKEQEAGYLVGYMAGLYAKDKGGKQVVSSVGGQKIPPVDHYIAGFQAGAKKANPDIKTLNNYSDSFTAADKCKELALNQIADGSQVIFQVAGGCGLGALDAAKEKGLQGIGVDSDQAYLGNYIMTSALKKVDEAVYNAAKQEQDGSLPAGKDTVASVQSGGVGYGKVNAVGQKYKAQVDKILDQIKSGELTDIPNTVAGT
jgi:basic membrane protein A and related proteins